MTPADAQWIDRWIGAVADGSARMSQRALSAIERHGGLPGVIEGARARGVHLVRLTDDRGIALVAASTAPFETLC